MKICFVSDCHLILAIKSKESSKSNDVFRLSVLPNEKVNLETGDYILEFTPIDVPL